MSALPELPRFVGCATCGEEPYYTAKQMREYARAAVAAEREACAALCEEHAEFAREGRLSIFIIDAHQTDADAIRARGDA